MTTYTITEELLQELRDYLQRQCGQRCNAEYNPCEAQEINEGLRTLQPNTQEPTLYQARVRPTWKDDKDWIDWETCSKESAEAYERTPLLHDWQYQVRRLYTTPAPQQKPLTAEQIDVISEDHGMTGIPLKDRDLLQFARAIEAAHGVKP